MKKYVRVSINGKDGYVFGADYEPKIGERIGMQTHIPVIVTGFVEERDGKMPDVVLLEKDRDLFKK